MAARVRGIAGTVSVWSPSASTRAACADTNWCGAVLEDPLEACRRADLVVLCGPVDRIPPLLRQIAPVCGEGCLVTDVGSTKAAICTAGAAAFPPGHPASFVGAHPMAGSEKSGLAHAKETLFEGRPCLVTPHDSANPSAVGRCRNLWEGLGMRVIERTPAEHDRQVARISHLPHLAASVLCSVLADNRLNDFPAAGPGLRDTTRVAAGDPDLWTAIFVQNREAVREALDAFEGGLERFRAALDDPHDLRTFLSEARECRRALDQDAPAP